MRRALVETFADALAMTINAKNGKVRGKTAVKFDLGGGLKFDFRLKIIHHFETSSPSEALLLLSGPNDLVLLLAHMDGQKLLVCGILDGAVLRDKMMWKDKLCEKRSVTGALDKAKEMGALKWVFLRNEKPSAKWRGTGVHEWESL